VNIPKPDGVERNNAEIDSLPEIQFLSNLPGIVRSKGYAVGHIIPIGEKQDKQCITAKCQETKPEEFTGLD
jgi:hypothetical protein